MPENKVNNDFLKKQREFWNIKSMYEAMFEKIYIDDKIMEMPLKEKVKKWERSAKESMRQILKDIPSKPDWKILEVGCGIGRIIKPLRESFLQVDGVDIAETMIEFSKQYLCDCLGNGGVYLNNGYDLSQFQDDTYDFIYSMITFQHIRSYSVVKSYLNEINRVLRPGGYFRLQVFDNNSPIMGKYNEEALADKQYRFNGNCYSKYEFTTLLEDHNFIINEIVHESPWLWGTVRKR